MDAHAVLGGTVEGSIGAEGRCWVGSRYAAETLDPGLAAGIEACSLADQVILCLWRWTPCSLREPSELVAQS